MGVSEIRGYLIGGPYDKGILPFEGSVLGVLIFGTPHAQFGFRACRASRAYRVYRV